MAIDRYYYRLPKPLLVALEELPPVEIASSVRCVTLEVANQKVQRDFEV